MPVVNELDHFSIWLYFLYTLLVITAILQILYQRRSPQNLMAWLLTILLLPVIGLLFYAILGSRKFFTKSKKPIINLHSIAEESPKSELGKSINNILNANGLPSASQNNTIQAFLNPVEAYNSFIYEIENAKTCIHIQTYIFELDNTGQAILNALIKKAKEGLEICLLMDAIGSFSLYRNSKPLQPLIQAGGQCAFFQPLFKSALNSQINLRNHRKIYLFDNQILLTGGMNISSDYLTSDDNHQTNLQWKDLLLKITGPTALHHQYIFNEDWIYSTKKDLKKLTHQPIQKHTNLNANASIQVIPSGPDIEKDVLFEAMLQSIYAAKTSIDIVSPYFIPDNSLMNAFLVAIKRGVKVNLITPQNSDHLIFDLGRSSYMRELHENGGKIYLDQSVMLHAKLMIVDHECAIIGSANLDYRSMFINHEIVNFIYSEQIINQMKTWIEKLTDDAKLYQSSSKKRHRLLENLTRIFAPIL